MTQARRRRAIGALMMLTGAAPAVGNDRPIRSQLVRGELYNNSFDAIAPGTQWMVAGEWGTMTHLEIYRTPLLNRQTSSHGGQLHLAGYIKLDHKVL